MHLLLIGSMLMEPKSWHRAKAVVCFSKRRAPSEEGMGISSSTAGSKARGYRPAADERKPLFALANDELRAKFAHGGRSEISEQGPKRRREKVSEGGPHRSLHGPYHCHMHWELRYGTLLMVPQAKLSYGCMR